MGTMVSSRLGALKRPSAHAIQFPVDRDLGPVDFDVLAGASQLGDRDLKFGAGAQGLWRTAGRPEAVDGFGPWQTPP